MTVRRFRQTNHAKNAPGFNWKTQVDADIQVMSICAGFAAHEADTPNMTVVVDAGRIQSGTTLTSKTAQTTGTITAPAANPRIDRIVMDYAGAISVITGAEAASPSAPAITASKVAVCQIALVVGQTRILNSDITDERPLYFIPDTLSSLTLGGVAVNLPVHFAAVATTSGTSITLINTIPTWARRVILAFSAVSTNGTSEIVLRIGPSGGVVSTGYAGSIVSITGAGVISGSNGTTGFILTDANAATTSHHGIVTLLLQDDSTNTWAATWGLAASNGARTNTGAGSIALSGDLSQIVLTTLGGANTFDNGSVGGRYEY